MKNLLMAVGLSLLLLPLHAVAAIGDPAFPHSVEVRTSASGRTWLLLRGNYPDSVERTEVEVDGEEVTITLHYHLNIDIMAEVPQVWAPLGYLEPGSYALTVRKLPADPPPYAGPSGEVSRTFEVVSSSGPTISQIPSLSAHALGLLALLFGVFAGIGLHHRRR